MISKSQVEKELRIGTKIEKAEHGFSMKMCGQIAWHHIKEFLKYGKLYYTDKRYGLIVMERKLKKR